MDPSMCAIGPPTAPPWSHAIHARGPATPLQVDQEICESALREVLNELNSDRDVWELGLIEEEGEGKSPAHNDRPDGADLGAA